MSIDVWKHYTGKEIIEVSGETSSIGIDILVSDEKEKKTGIKDSFENTFKDYYFLNNNGKYRPKKVNKSKQSNKDVEKIFFEGNKAIFNRKVWYRKDVLDILAWKTGNIDHQRSKDNSIEYKSGFIVSSNKEKDEYEIKLISSNSKITFNDFADNIISLRKKYYDELVKTDKCNDICNTVWEKIYEYGKNVSGLGTVYLITMLFFITKGKCPIYDRFAMAALLAMLLAKKYEESNNNESLTLLYMEGIVKHTTLPPKAELVSESGKLKKLSEITKYNDYILLLRYFFDEDWKNNRDIDRALWVYGHYFDVPQ